MYEIYILRIYYHIITFNHVKGLELPKTVAPFLLPLHSSIGIVPFL